MRGTELLRKLRRYAKDHELTFRELRHRGKGDHCIVYLGDRFSVIPHSAAELKTGTLHAICKQLGVDREAL